MEELDAASTEELRELLARLKADLAEVQEERKFVLSQTGRHISGKTVREYEQELAELRAELAAVKEALRSREA